MAIASNNSFTDVLNEGESPKSELKSLASDGYFFSDVSDYMDNVQALCKGLSPG